MARKPEFATEKELVDEIKEYARAMNVYVEVAGQRIAKGSGSTEGLTDMFVCVAGWYMPCEVKNGDTKVRLDQIGCAMNRADAGHPTAWVRSTQDFVDLVNWCRRNPRRCPPLPEHLAK